MKLKRKSRIEKAAETIKGYCSKHTFCDERCKFYTKSGDCFFEKGALPCDWNEEKGRNVVCLTEKD